MRSTRPRPSNLSVNTERPAQRGLVQTGVGLDQYKHAKLARRDIAILQTAGKILKHRRLRLAQIIADQARQQIMVKFIHTVY